MHNGNLIANARVKKGLAQIDMAKLLNLGLTAYKDYENGTKPIKIELLNVLSNLFDLSLDYMLNISEYPKIPENFKIADEIDYRYLRFSLKYHRRIKRITQKILAQEFGISPATISQYERNAKIVPISYLIAFAKKFHISVDYMCGKSRKKEIL